MTLDSITVEEASVPDTRASMAEQVRLVLAERLDERVRALRHELSRLNDDTDGDRTVVIMRELQQLEERRRRLRQGGTPAGVGADGGR